MIQSCSGHRRKCTVRGYGDKRGNWAESGVERADLGRGTGAAGGDCLRANSGVTSKVMLTWKNVAYLLLQE